MVFVVILCLFLPAQSGGASYAFDGLVSGHNVKREREGKKRATCLGVRSSRLTEVYVRGLVHWILLKRNHEFHIGR